MEAPEMFRRPSDPPEPLPQIRASNPIGTLHTEWARMHSSPPEQTSPGRRLSKKVRLAASRMTNRADHRLLGDLVRAVDAVAERCDELSERAANLEVIVDDLARILGEEVTHLRAAAESRAPEGLAESSLLRQ
jgi:hypothetical protein